MRLTAKRAQRGIRVKTSSMRHHVNITMTQAKAVSNHTNSILKANMEATDEGYDVRPAAR